MPDYTKVYAAKARVEALEQLLAALAIAKQRGALPEGDFFGDSVSKLADRYDIERKTARGE